MLAYLALHLGSYCSREAMYEVLWADEDDPQVVANRFRVTLASLRRHLEPEEVPFGSVLDVSEPKMVRLRPETVSCDVFEFRTLWRQGKKEEALLLAQEPLLPAYYDEWAVNSRNHYDHLIETLTPQAEVRSVPFAASANAEQTPPSPRISPEQRIVSLPLALTHFFGREREKQTLLTLLHTNRLVTLTGIGGIGKTRLAVETAKEIEWNCLFVSLEHAATLDQVNAALRKAIGANLQEPTPLTTQLGEFLTRHGETLLILDNTEHLVESTASLCLALLGEFPSLHLLNVGRQRLNLPGEAVLSLPPLETAPASVPVENLLQFPSVALFVDRAAKARPDFLFSARNADAIAEICTRLEGIPLALELAAAHVVAQTPGQIAHSLRRDLLELKSRQRGLPERHRALRTVFETSLNLLPSDVRAFCCQLAALQKEWTLEGARAMTGCERAEEYLETLVASSWLMCSEDETQGVMRFAFMETTCQFLKHRDAAEETPPDWDRGGNLIINGNFETDRSDQLWITNRGGMFAHPFLVPFGWKGVDSVNINVPTFAVFPNGIPSGTNVAAVGDHTLSGRLFQDVDAVLTSQTTYTLTAWIGNRLDYSGSGRITLETVSGQILADSSEVEPPKGTFQQVHLTFTADDTTPCLGEGLRVGLERLNGYQANFDGICLTASQAE